MNSSDITSIIFQTINSLLENFVSSIDSTLFNILDDLVFIDESILKTSFFESILGTSSYSGLVLIANSLLIAFIIFYCFRLLYCNYTSQPIEAPSHVVLKLIICSICINSSFYLCEHFLGLNSILSLSIKEIGSSLFKSEISFSSLIQKLNKEIYTPSNSFNIFSFDGLIKGMISFSLLNLIFSYGLRYVIIKLFCFLTPFAILSLINKSTSWFFKSWLKCLFSLLIMQEFISLILLIIFSVNFNSGTMSKLIYIGGIYALVYINSYIRQFIGGISTDVSINLGNISNLLSAGRF